MMRIAVFSDIHGNLEALQAIISDIKSKNFDEIICLGDVLSLGPNPRECLELIMNYNIKMVLGNHEMYYLNDLSKYNDVGEGERKHLEWVKNALSDKHYNYLKSQDIVYGFTEISNFLFMHFPYDYDNDNFYPLSNLTNSNRDEMFKSYDADIIMMGHEHKRLEFNIGNKKIYCLGSSGCTKTFKTHYTMIEIDKFVSIKRVELDFDRETFEKKLNDIEYPEKEFLASVFFNYIV